MENNNFQKNVNNDGKNVEQVSGNVQAFAKSQKRKTAVLLIILLVFVLITGIIVGMFISKNKNDVAKNITEIAEEKENKQEIEVPYKEKEAEKETEKETNQEVEKEAEKEQEKETEQDSSRNSKISYFEQNKNLNYTSNPKDSINGKVAIIKLGEKIFQTQKHDGYYTYTDDFGNSYNIKEITNITSEYRMTGNDNWANLFKAVIEYVDNNDNKKSFDTAVIVPTDVSEAYISGPYDNYTGTTTFVRGFTNLYDDGNEDETNQNKENSNNTANYKNSFKVTYETVGIRNITIEGSSFVCNENVPHITGISSNAAEKIEKYLKDWHATVWKDINEQAKDEEVREILKQMNESGKSDPNFGGVDIGFTQSYEVIYLTDKIVTFEHILEGGLGGVSWGTTSGKSFDLQTGEPIEIKNIVTSKDGYIQACKKYSLEQIKKDSRYNEVLEMHRNDYEAIINSAIEQLDGYFVEDGIVCAELPKYEIASGASGEFRFTVPYDLIKNYISNKYIEK